LKYSDGAGSTRCNINPTLFGGVGAFESSEECRSVGVTIGLDIDERTSRGESAVTLKLAGELDVDSVRALERVAERHLAAGRKVVTLDLSDLMFIDSTGLAAIVLVSRLCEREGRELSIIRGPRPVQRLFEITGLIDVLPFEVADRATS
jgi:anti-sigma B factor antagonist